MTQPSSSVQRLAFYPEPITKKELLTSHTKLLRIYTNKKGQTPLFSPIKEKKGGCAIGTIYELKGKNICWIGKVGEPHGRFKNDPATPRTCTEKDVNFDAIKEKFAYDLYEELARVYKLFAISL